MVYNQAIVRWQITKLNPIAVNFDLNRNDYFDTDTYTMTPEMQSVISNPDIVAAVANYAKVIYVIKKGSGNYGGQAMLNSQHAFVYSDMTQDAKRTASHELGHSTGGLIDLYNTSPPSTDTQNLMHYDGTRLRHSQWKAIQDKK